MSGVDRRAFLKQSAQTVGAATILAIKGAAPAAAHSGLTDLTATEAVAAMTRGDITAEAYAQALLERAAALPQLNAFRVLDGDLVREAARDADRKRAAGAKLGQLHGLPIPVKDSVNTRTLPTSYGTAALRDFRPAADAAVVKALSAQGGILMGKTNLHELSFGWTSNNGTFGPVRNPYDLSRIPGGSSGGSAAAVAARIAPLAVAEDTWASIRLPAACCGLTGLRPTYGRYPDEGIMPLTTIFDQVGPVARTVADLALFDAAVTGEAGPIDPLSLKGVRIGVPRRFFWEGLDAEVERLATEALRKLTDAGAVVVEAPLPEIVERSPDVAATIISFEAQASIAGFLARSQAGVSFDGMFASVSDNVKTLFKALALPPNRPSLEQHEAALALRAAMTAQMTDWFARTGAAALLFPATMVPPPPIGAEDEVTIGGARVPLAAAVARNMALGSCTGFPSLVVPAGLTRGGLPVGLEVLGLGGSDRALLALGLALAPALGRIPAPKL
ncbi:amidase family protein [Chelatococcus asaccharovorans]|uniref:Mandelamide amidase n=1 Tax=Chelatococcus asaccharovorans TaxID=28210 RepID=A0A2V3UJI1_9HYPH|nr:amidase family protein [Chelatococcus asaccharovorans]MBS7701838.1 indole acetimide hydrolase [Chelatococcus asaccharovorans]PXW64454.1 mandelamide amidase [Chelatococcus asaccharovorans]